MPAQVIKISGARQHNLKNLHVEIPREKLVVITGLSGSGKSSLAFDTLYAEGKRRYVESLSAYARQFLDKMEKPDVDFIEGLSPAISIDQRSAGANPRSTIATTTEIYDYLRVLFSAVGQPHDPVTGQPLSRETPQQIVDQILAYEPESKIVLLAPLIENQLGEFRDIIEKIGREGFVRARIDGEIMELDRSERIRLKKNERHTIEAVVDRLVVRDGIRIRLTDSIETALKWGGNRVVLLRQRPGDGVMVKRSNEKIIASTSQHSNTSTAEREELVYSTDYGNAATGFRIGELTPRHFSFNSHLGACPACHGLGTQLVCDPELMISDPGKTLAEGAITPWRRGTKRMQAYYRHLQKALVKHFHIDEDVPFSELPDQFKQALYFGTNGTPIEMDLSNNGPADAGKVAKPFEGLVPQMQRLYEQTESEFTRNRIRSFMTYEPCIGLHQRDNARLLGTLRRLRDLGNSVIVVEHDEETIRAADHIIDLGPGAGPRGGEIVAQGKLEDILRAKNSLTADYLSGRARISIPKQRAKPRSTDQSDGWLTLVGATENNLKNITVSFPLGCFTCVTGVSGSGKSTLVDDILRRALFRRFHNAKEKPGAHRVIRGVEQIDKAIVIDQSPIGRTPRSNPVTYTGAFTPIRELFSQLPAARVRGYDAGRFSFNVKGGRCENCEGDGLIKI